MRGGGGEQAGITKDVCTLAAVICRGSLRAFFLQFRTLAIEPSIIGTRKLPKRGMVVQAWEHWES